MVAAWFLPLNPSLPLCLPRPALARRRSAGYGESGLDRSVGVEFRATPTPCIALVRGGQSANVHCAQSDSTALLGRDQVGAQPHTMNHRPQTPGPGVPLRLPVPGPGPASQPPLWGTAPSAPCLSGPSRLPATADKESLRHRAEQLQLKA